MYWSHDGLYLNGSIVESVAKFIAIPQFFINNVDKQTDRHLSPILQLKFEPENALL